MASLTGFFARGFRVKSGLTFDDAIGIGHTTTDPSSGSGTDAPIGSYLIQTASGKRPIIWEKYSSGDTSWQRLGTIYEVSGVPNANNDRIDTASAGILFRTGDAWINTNTSPNTIYFCTDDTATAAVWVGMDQSVTSSSSPDFHGLNFDIGIAAPAHAEGKVFYDIATHSLAYYNEESDVTVNLGREVLVRVKNETGIEIPNGAAVYPSGTSSDGEALMSLANASSKNKCRFVGVATHNIPNGQIGYVTRIGEVHGLDTSIYSGGGILYLSTVDGEMTNVRPTDGAFVIPIGAVKVIDPNDGVIIVDIKGADFSVEQSYNMGFSPSETATLSFVDADPGEDPDLDRTLHLTPTGAFFSFYQYADKYEKAIDSIQIPDEEGMYVIYYHLGTIAYVKNPTKAQIEAYIKTNPVVAYIYWDATNKTHLYLGKEMHGISISPHTHAYLHSTFGFKWVSGLAPNTISADASGNLTTSAQFGMDIGYVTDEDNQFSVGPVSSTTGLPIFYISGSTSAPTLRRIINTGYSVSTTGTGRLAYNTVSGGNYVLAEATDRYFVCCHVIATNENTDAKRLYATIGQAQYATAAEAAAAAESEIANAKLLSIIPPELKAIVTFVFETDNRFGNAVKARVVSISPGKYYVDWRTIQVGGGGAGGGTTVVPVFDDSAFKIFDNLDPTKLVQFQVSGLTTEATRVYTCPDASGTLLLDDPTGTGKIVHQTSPALITPSADYITLDNAPIEDYHGTRKDYIDGFFPVQEDNIYLNDVTTNDVSITKHGYAPKAPNDTSKFLRGDGTWNAPPGGAGDVTGPASAVDGNFASFNLTTGKIIKDSGSKAADFAVAAKGVTNGDSHNHIGGDGAAIAEGALSISDVTTGNASTSAHGFLKKLPNDAGQYMNGAGNWTVPADGDAIHDNVSAEINAITAKTGLSLNDIFVIEDYAASWAKKKATLGNMLKVKRGLTSITSDTTISSLTRDETYIVNASSMITLTLPDASTYAGYEVTVYLSSDHGVTISPASGNTIGGFSAGPQLYDNRNHVRLLAMGDDNWIILGMLSTYDSGILACSDWTTRALGAAWVAGTWTGTPVAGETFTQYTNAACTTQSTPAMTGIFHFSYGVHAFRNVSGSGGCFITGYYLKGSVSGAVLAITTGSKNVNAATLFQCASFVGDKQISKLTYLPAYDAGNEEYDIDPYNYSSYNVGRYISYAYMNESYELGASGFQYINSSQTVTTVASTNAFYRITRQAII